MGIDNEQVGVKTKNTNLVNVFKAIIAVVSILAVSAIAIGIYKQGNVKNIGAMEPVIIEQVQPEQKIINKEGFNLAEKTTESSITPSESDDIDKQIEYQNKRSEVVELTPYQKYLAAEKIRVLSSYVEGYKTSIRGSNKSDSKLISANNKVDETQLKIDSLTLEIERRIAGVQGLVSGKPEVVGQSEQVVDDKEILPKPGQLLLCPGTIIELRPDVKSISSFSGTDWRGLVTRDVYDCNMRAILIPSGSRVIGKNEGIKGENGLTDVGLALVVNDIYRPDNKKIEIEKPASGADGSGLVKSNINRHNIKRFTGFVAYALLGNYLVTNSGNNQAQSAREQGIYDITSKIKDATDEKAGKYFNIPPTISLEPGQIINVLITKNIWIEPYSNIDKTIYTRY